jgi:hypothetical protein
LAAQPDKWAPLHIAALCGKVEMVRSLLEEGVEVDLRDAMNMTPIQWAASRGREDVVQLLLEEGADVTTKDSQGTTPLHQAASGGNESVVKALLQGNAEKNAKDYYNWTPFHVAWMYQSGICDLLSGSSDETESLKTAVETTPSHWVKPFESSRITIGEDGLTLSSGNVASFSHSSLRLLIRRLLSLLGNQAILAGCLIESQHSIC